MQKGVEKLVHISLWLMLLALLYSSAGRMTRILENATGEAIVSVSYDPVMLVILGIDILFKALFFYGNVYFIVPRLRQNRLKGPSILWVGLLFVLTLVFGFGINSLISTYFSSESIRDLSLDYAFPYSLIFHCFILFMSLGYTSLLDKKKHALTQERLREEKLIAELKYLKSQVNPHFLFNTLNNIYSLVRKHDDPRAAESIARLARLMRYMIYDSNAETVTLKKEVDYLNDFIDLQKVRLYDQNKVSYHVDLNQGAEHPIAPMLLIPFVENAFKHGRESDRIFIEVTFDKGELVLRVKNAINTTSQTHLHQGLGLENVRKRLNILYPSGYKLKIQESDLYEVELRLTL